MAKKTDENVKKTKKAVKEEKTKKKTVAKVKESAKATKTLQNATNVKEELTTKETKKKALDGAKNGLKTNSEKGLKTVKKIDANENVPEAVVPASGKSKTKKKHNKNKFNNSKKHSKDHSQFQAKACTQASPAQPHSTQHQPTPATASKELTSKTSQSSKVLPTTW